MPRTSPLMGWKFTYKTASTPRLAGFHREIRSVPKPLQHSFDEIFGIWAERGERWAAGILDAPASVTGVEKTPVKERAA